MMAQKRMYGPRLIWLQTFLASVEHGSISAGAEVVGCDQSQATRYIQDLETWLGRKFFTFDTSLSIEGKEFHAVAQQVVALMYESRTGRALDKRSTPVQKVPKSRLRSQQ